jgi:hypothetical protein
MSLFGNRIEKPGSGHSANAEAEPQIPPAPRDAAASEPPLSPGAQAFTAPSDVVDAVKRLEKFTESIGSNLYWKFSTAALLKLLGLDSSLAGRKELAEELGCPPETMGSAAQMNQWLHKTVLQKLVLLD